MCDFLSGIVLKNGYLITSDYTDLHGLIAEDAGLKERRVPLDMGWVNVEYTSDNLLDINTYELKVDESDVPDWFDDSMREKITKKMHRLAKKCILIDGEIPILLGGKWIIGGEVKIQKAVNSLIVQMCGGTLDNMFGGTIDIMLGGTLDAMFGGIINTMKGGTINIMKHGTIDNMWEGTIKTMWDGIINNMNGGKLNTMRGGIINNIVDGTIDNIKGGTIIQDNRIQ